jgi:tRNA A-37 threonylcarbamoyl transferase component Bud32
LSSEQWHPILLAVFAELSRFHQAGGYHGRPALRDIVLDSESHLTFIDLEESGTNNDPALMARDIFLLLMDLRRLPQISSAQKLEYLQHWQAQAPQAAYEALEELHQVVKKLAPIGRLVLKFKNNKTALDYLSAVETLSTYLSK